MTLPPSGVAPPPSRRAPRSVFLTAVGWILIVAGAIIIPVSFVSSLMILAGSHGTANASFFGGLIIIGGPPATLVAGIGVLRRWRWAYAYVVALLIAVTAFNLVQLLRGSTPERSTVSPDGVIHTVLASSVDYPLHLLIIAICVGLLVKLLTPATRAEFFHRPGGRCRTSSPRSRSSMQSTTRLAPRRRE